LRTVVVTHTDLDGTASAAILLRYLGRIDKFLFIQPSNLAKALSGLNCGNECSVYICDLSPNSSNFTVIAKSLSKLVGKGVTVWWFDHHIWDANWISELGRIGVRLFIDRYTCAAGAVVKYLGIADEVSVRLARAACSLDMWVFDDWLGNFLARYVGFSKSSNWRRRTAEKLSLGGLFDEEVLRVVEESVDRELKILSEALRKSKVREVCGGIRIAYYYKSVKDHVTSYIASLQMSRFSADVALICRKGSASLRSRGSVNVREVAKKLGGGGHEYAAGFSIRPRLLHRILLYLGITGPYTEWCVSRVEEALCRDDSN
jgi:oligoribonuclease NrnB/cAMP/cGMP phosphodiesterase (DHH superfamily)